MQLQLTAQVATALHGTVLVAVGHNAQGLYATYRAAEGLASNEASEAAWAALLAALKIIGYYAKFEAQPGRRAGDQPSKAIRFSTTQSYSASWLLYSIDAATLSQLDQDELREVIGQSVILYRRVAPAGRMFNELATVWQAADPEVRTAIRQSLKRV